MTIENQQFDNQSLDFNSQDGQVVTLEDLFEKTPTNVATATDKEIELETPEEPIIQTPEKVQEEVEPIHSNSEFKNLYQQLVDKKVWEAVDTIETDDGDTPLDDVDFDEEMFNALVEHQRDILLQKNSKEQHLSDFTKQLIEIEKNGGDVSAAINAFNTIKTPLDAIDRESPEGREQLLIMNLRAKGATDDVIPDMIAGYKAKGVFDEKVDEADEEIKTAFEAHIESIKTNAVKAKEAMKEQLSTYKKDLKDTMSQFSLNPNTLKRFVDAATKKDENGQFEMDVVYNTIRRDPKKAAELALYLLDRNEFLKQVTNEARTEEKKNVAQKFKFIKRTGDSINLTGQKPKNDKEIDLNNL